MTIKEFLSCGECRSFEFLLLLLIIDSLLRLMYVMVMQQLSLVFILFSLNLQFFVLNCLLGPLLTSLAVFKGAGVFHHSYCLSTGVRCSYHGILRTKHFQHAQPAIK